jgi:two-component system, OmpR family, sensor histidine kinase VicK
MRQSNSVLESVGDGIYGMDLEGRITVINPAAALMLGYRPDELLGRKAHELIHHSNADGTPYPEEDDPIQKTLVNRTTTRVSNEVFWRKDGTCFPVEYVAKPQIESQAEDANVPAAAGVSRALRHEVRKSFGGATDASDFAASGTSVAVAIGDDAEAQQGDAGEPGPEHEERAVGVVVAFTDISERNALDRMKDEFISTVSHELRTPLTSLHAALGLVAGGALSARPEKVRQMMDIAMGNTDRLVRLVNDILEFERISSGKTELHSVYCPIDELFRRVTALQQTSAMKANVRFTIEGNGVKVWADPDRLLQTLTNLVSNAIKFSPQSSGIPSQVRLKANYLTEDEALIEVQDHGRGIPQDKLEQIFERFKQVDASDSRAKGGTGLGLAICRSIVTQHGGHIWATSVVGEGATFHFTLPTKPSGHLS